MKKIKFDVAQHPYLVKILTNFTDWRPWHPYQNTCALIPYMLQAAGLLLCVTAICVLIWSCVANALLWAIFSFLAGTYLIIDAVGVVGIGLVILALSFFALSFFSSQYCEHVHKWLRNLRDKHRGLDAGLNNTRLISSQFFRDMYRAIRDKVCIEIEVVDSSEEK